MIVGKYVVEVTGRLALNVKAREWCKLPYPGHPEGCPNFGKKKECPPEAPLLHEVVDLSKPMWLVAVEFDLEEHMWRMWEKHPNWSYRQARCVLYWQPAVDKALRIFGNEQCRLRGADQLILNLDALGVNVLVTAWNVGLPVELKPVNRVFKIGLVCWKLQKKGGDQDG